MYPRTNYEMTAEDLAVLLDAMHSVPAIVIGGITPRSRQENANAAWAALGKKMGFDHMTVSPNGKGDRFFSAVPSETNEQREQRLKREAEQAHERELADVQSQIDRLEARREELMKGQHDH